MTEHIKIGDITPRIHYEANGSQTEFTYPIFIFENDNLKVYLGETLQTTGYSVSGAGNSNGGSVTFDTAPANEVFVTIERSLTIIRQSDFQAGGAFRASVINDELDFQTAALQEVAENQNRSIYLPPMDASADLKLPLASARANRALAFDADGDVTAGPLVTNVTYAEEYATNAATSATAAALSESNSGTSEDNASASATAAANSVSSVELPDPATANTYIKRNAENTAYVTKTATEVATDVISQFETAITDDDSKAPTSGAVVDYVAENAVDGALTLLATQTASNSSYIDFTSIPSGYSKYILDFHQVETALSTVDYMLMRFFDNGVLDTTTDNYGYNIWYCASTTIGIEDDRFSDYIKIGTLWYNGYPHGHNSGSIQFSNINAGAVAPVCWWTLAPHGGDPYSHIGQGLNRKTPTNIDGIRLYLAASNIVTGTFKLYGVS